MRGQLLPDRQVALDPRTAEYNGSWIDHSGDPLLVYGQDMIALFFDRIKDLSAPVVLDIGANTGSFCLLAAFHPLLRVYAFEPVAEVYGLLCANIAVNWLADRVSSFPVALSDYIGRGTMTVPYNLKQSGLSFLDDRAPSMPCRTEVVQVTTLDLFCAKHAITHVDAIKIDVEGHESEVLKGGIDLIARDHPLIMAEATDIDETIPLLEAWGYTVENHTTDLLATWNENKN